MASQRGLGSLGHSSLLGVYRGGCLRRGALALLSVLCLLAPGAWADGNLEWATAMGGPGTNFGHGIAVDDAGNVYTTGRFQDIVNFGPFQLTTVGNENVFVAKQASDGSFLWARSIGGSELVRAFGIAVDDAGNVYTTGSFVNTVDFDPGPGTFNITSSGFHDIFVSKLDSNGDFVWARIMGGPNVEEGRGIALDSAGDIVVSGYFSQTVDFDPGPSDFNLTSSGDHDIFVAKLDSNGDFIWARSFGGTGEDICYDLALDSANNVYTTGEFSGTVDFDPGPASFNLSSAGSSDVFVSKLDTNGDFVWARAMGGAELDLSISIAVDGAGNAYTTGWFGGTADFDPGPDSFHLESAGELDVFVSKLDTNGNFVWARSVGGTNGDGAYGIAVDVVDGVYITGAFSSIADLDPGPGTFNRSSAGGWDAFVTKLDTNGDLVWAGSMGGAGNDRGWGITVDDTGAVYATGEFSLTADFDPGPGTFNLTSAGNFDIFVLKLSDVPTVIDITPSTTGPTNATSVDFAVTFDEAVVNFNDLSDLIITHAGTAHTGVTITGGPEIYTVTVDGISGDGAFTLAVNTTSDVEDLEGNALAASVTSVPVIIDNTPPNAFVITPATTGPTNISALNFTVIFDEVVQGFDNFADLVINHSGTANTGVSIAGGPQAYTVTIGGISGDGAFTLAINTASDVTDLAGNALASSVVSAPILIDTIAPKAVLVSPDTTSPTNAESVDFTVAFDEPVQDFNDMDDLVIAHTGTAHTGVTISGGPEVYAVTVEGISGSGTFTLTVNTASDVADLVGNPLLLSVTSAAVVIDNTAPHASIITPATTGPTNAATIDFIVSFDEPVQGFDDIADVHVDHNGPAHTGASITGGPESYTVTIEGISGDGSLALSVNTASDVTDLVGNPLASSVTSAPVAIDNTPPSITALAVSPFALTPGDMALIQFDVSEMLQGDPLVQVAGTPAAVAPLEGIKSLSHSYAWTAPADPPVGRLIGRTLVPDFGYINPDPWPYGPQSLTITLTDIAGNTGAYTESEGLALVSGLPVAQPMLAVLAMLCAAAFVFRIRRKEGSDTDCSD